MSMTRLLLFMSFFPASVVVLKAQSADTLGWFLTAYAIGYVGGKTADIFTKPKEATNGISLEVLESSGGGVLSGRSINDPTIAMASQPSGGQRKDKVGSGDS